MLDRMNMKRIRSITRLLSRKKQHETLNALDASAPFRSAESIVGWSVADYALKGFLYITEYNDTLTVETLYNIMQRAQRIAHLCNQFADYAESEYDVQKQRVSADSGNREAR